MFNLHGNRMFLRPLIALFLLTSSLLRAGDEHSDWFYRAWQTEDGLPDNSISGIVQSPDGYLWIGTNAGLIRFNGHEFSALALRDIPNLPSRQVRTLSMDRQGGLWLGMERGPVIGIQPDSFRIIGHPEGLPDKRVVDIVDDAEGRIWVVFSTGVVRIEGDKILSLTTETGVPTDSHPCIVCDTDGQVWLTSGGKLGRLSDQGFELVEDFHDVDLRMIAARDSGILLTDAKSLFHLSSGSDPVHLANLPEELSINTLYEDSEGAVWICTQRKGLLRIFNGKVTSVPTSHAWIECITEDREGNIWAGTNGGGLNLIRPREVQFLEETDGLPFLAIRSTACDARGRVWAVSQEGELAYQEDGQWHPWPHLEEGTIVHCVTIDSRDQVWIGTKERGLLKIEGDKFIPFRVNEGLASPYIRSLLPTRNGDLYIATDNPDQLHRLRDGSITRIQHSVEFHALRALAETADGTIWAGASDGHLFRIEDNHLINESSLDGPDALSIRALHATPDGSLWIGYAGDGLGHLKNKKYKRFTTEDGLFDDFISQIRNDGKGFLWALANRGLFKVNLQSLLAATPSPQSSLQLRCQVFGLSHGVPSIQPSRDYFPADSQSPLGSLFFPTHSGILEVRQDKVGENKLSPPVVLEKVILDGDIVATYKAHSLIKRNSRDHIIELGQPKPHLELPPGHDKLAINFAALSLTSPENVQVRYRLHPIDRHWQDVENRHNVTFSRLPAGRYQFQVIACNNAGVWNKTGATLAFTVRPFYWETWWFKVGIGGLTALLAGGLVFAGLRRKHHHQLREVEATRALEQERSRIARDIHDDLGASLTRISLLSQASPGLHDEATNKTFDQIQTTTRHLMRSMDGVVWAINPEHDSFDELANYLSSYAQEFLSVANISCRLEMPMILPDLRLSAQLRHSLLLALKEALNNVVKYAGATEVRISLKPGKGFFSLKVQDNGSGIDPNSPADPRRTHAGSGLANMENRMEQIGGACLLTSIPGEGTSVEFKIPFKAQS